MSDLSSRFHNLRVSLHGGEVVDEDFGGAIGHDSVGGGGRSTVRADHEIAKLRVSHALRAFLVDRNVLSEKDANLDDEGDNVRTPALTALLARGDFVAPPEILDRRHPLPEYFVSSSHNTYLMAHQLYGKSSAEAYETAIRTGSRCVEIDAWDNSDDKDEPKVTHGYTLVSHISFRAVCETIRDMHDEEAAISAKEPGHAPTPILLSLENHCGPEGQRRLVEIMHEVFGERLLTAPLREELVERHEEEHKADGRQHDPAEHVTLQELGDKIAVIVEHHFGDEVVDSDSQSEDEEDEEFHEAERKAREAYKANKKEEAKNAQIIIPELAALGVYAQSVKPRDNTWFDPGELLDGPHHHLINVSESGLSGHLPANAASISIHNSKHLMRVFPKGTRISSSNLKPVRFWGLGAQICALNWQTFGTSNQLNDALFAGSDGYILKPPVLRQGGSGSLSTGRKKRLRLHIGGATDVPLHADREGSTLKPYLTCTLHSALLDDTDVPKRKTGAYKHHKLGFLHRGENPPATDPIWDETLEWTYEDNELVFLRMLIKSDDAWARNPMFAVSAVRLSYTRPGWNFVRFLDMQGRETKCTVLLNFDIQDIAMA
ncbi:hypothetical protein PWT90_03411 [Aphanocladium album]|nr:hypothetical protein PWT90_03411 [Aphanocladium album]